MTSTGTFTWAVIAATASIPWRNRKPLARACWVAACMTGPSITGSVYGRPSSMTSTPLPARATAASMLSVSVGNPTGR